jgi:hypothetical protein
MVTKIGVVSWHAYNNNKFTQVLYMLHPQIIPGACRPIVLTTSSFMLLTLHKAIENRSYNTFISILKQDINIKSSILPTIWLAS